MTFTPLGDQAVLVYAAGEAQAANFARAVKAANPIWLEDVVPAYASVGIHFNASSIGGQAVIDWLRSIKLSSAKAATGREVAVPVCYEMGEDLARAAKLAKLKPDALIAKHLETLYTVYAIGFVPGFPYLGYLPAELAGLPRLDSPRVRVEPGSVGLAGKQTGIYPSAIPGGWTLIGRTPLKIVDVAAGFFPLQVGDRVKFTRIDDAEFRRLEGERLPCS